MTIHEALLRAYVAGWNDGHAGVTSDDRKHVIAADLGDQLDAHSVQSDLLEELGRCAALLERLAERLFARNRTLSQQVAEAARVARATLERARAGS